MLATAIQSPNPKIFFLNVIYCNIIPGARLKYNSVKQLKDVGNQENRPHVLDICEVQTL